MGEKANLLNAIPDWAFEMAISEVHELSGASAACVMIGVNPEFLDRLDLERLKLWTVAGEQIESWVCDDELQVAREDEAGRRYFRLNDLRDLATSRGWFWDVPTKEAANELLMTVRQERINDVLSALKVQPIVPPFGDLQSVLVDESEVQYASPPVDEALLARLQKSERMSVGLQHEVKRLQEQVKSCRDHVKKLTELTAQVGQLEAENANAKAEIDRLKTEIGSGKVVATWQKMVIGIAVDSYGYDPNATRSTVPTDIANDLAKVGISLDVDTIRARLKEAANVHLSKTKTQDRNRNRFG